MKRLALAVALVLAASVSAQAATPTISEYATRLVGKPTPVHCMPMTGEAADDLGFTYQVTEADGTETMGPEIYLSPPLCYALSLAIQHRPGNPQTLGTALEVLTHEATHITLNSGDESVVSCNAMLHIDRTIRLFGLGSRLHELHEAAWASYWDSPDEYIQDPVCRAHPHDKYGVIGPVLDANVGQIGGS